VPELKQQAFWKTAVPILRDATIVTIASAAIALTFNAIRSDGIRLVQQEEYDILVPCPEPVGDPEQIEAQDPRVKDERSLLLDVREKEDFEKWHMEGARNQPFDWLGPPIDEEVKTVAKQVAASRAQRVIIYGDGDDPDSGKEWAKLLSGANIKNVFYVVGGAPALNPALPKPQPPPSLDEPPEPVDQGEKPSDPSDSNDADVQQDTNKEAP